LKGSGTEMTLISEYKGSQQHLCLGVVVKVKKWLKYLNVLLNLRKPMH